MGAPMTDTPSPTKSDDAVEVLATLTADGTDTAVRIVSLTQSGALVALPSGTAPPAADTAADLAGGPLKDDCAGRVAWAAGNQVAIAFDPPQTAYAAFLTREILKLKDPRERRKFPRCSVLMSGTVRALGVEVQCVVQNVSLGGVRLRIMENLAHDGVAILNIPRFGDFESDVAWQSKDAMGLRFRITPHQVAALVGDALPRVIPASFLDAGPA